MASKNNVIFLIFTTIFLSKSYAEVYSAISDLPPLLNTYKLVINDLDEYIQKEEKRIFALKKNLDVFKKEYAIAMEDIANYLGNPINGFTLIKRLTIDLKIIEDRANLSIEFIRNVFNNFADNTIVPDTKDLFGAAIGLRQLQKTYKLQVHELAEGKINGVSYSLPMSADDCFGMGRVMYKIADYNNSIEWMQKALSKYKDEVETDVYSFTPVDAMEQMSSSYYKLGDDGNASVWVKNAETIYPNYDVSQTNLSKLFEIEITRDLFVDDFEENSLSEILYGTNITLNDMYMALCRGEYEPAPEITKRLTCFYLNKNHPFLRLAAIKTEQLYIDPDVFLFYDVINDREIKHVKAVTRPQIIRAQVKDSDMGSIDAHYRIGKYNFIKSDDVINSRISQRLADFTGLTMESAELLQVVNYGVGGRYDPHYDHAHDNSTFEENDNRIATVLFYMSEVAQGGATVFTELGLSVFPVKNAALFWTNLLPSGEGDFSTMHAGCPVLQGSKWVLTKWIHIRGQEFHRPCTLEYQTAIDRTYRPTPVLKSLT